MPILFLRYETAGFIIDKTNISWLLDDSKDASMKQFPQLTLLALAISSLAACGGGSSGSSGAKDSTNGVTVSGRAADGYLVNARVCLDLNENLICDAGEPSDTTDENGAYELAATAEQKAQYSVVVEVIKDQTIDTDTDAVVTASYTLTAPAGQSFVSPMTTLVNAAMRANAALTIEQAAEQVALSMSLPESTDLLADYIAGDDTNAHAAAQNFAQVLGSALASAQALAGGNGIAADRYGDVFNALVQRMQDQAGAIAQASGSELAAIDLIDDGEDLDDLVDDGEADSEVAEAVPVLTDGLTVYHVTSDYSSNPRYDLYSFGLYMEDDLLNFSSTTTAIADEEDDDEYTPIVWTASGWAVEDSYNQCSTSSVDNDLIVSCGVSWREKFSFSQTALDGTAISDYLVRASKDWLDSEEMPSLISVTAVFDDSAYEYSLVSTFTKERLALYDCAPQEEVAIAELDCGGYESFSSLNRDNALEMEYLADNGVGGVGYVYLGGNPATDSTGPIFLKVDNSEDPEDTSLDTQISTWQKVTLADNGPTIIKLTRFGSDLDLPEYNALVVFNDKVQHAEYYPVAAVSTDRFYLNKAASDQLETAISSLFPIITPVAE